ncbi:DUF2062 domain-containing protein [Lentisphaerota bacterium ZTH]|nr:DUF2062 domain-containing protein [Lentisphaerota bacterium]WET07582.1 DUF2062 domain-containing protein [Lentisphaerota bacterium ZTH]
MKKISKHSLAYYYFKLVKQSGNPEYIARGVSLGFFVGLLIPFGAQIIVVLPLAILFKAAKIPAVACTFVTNHVTIFFIYPFQCWVGSYLIARPLTMKAVEHMFKEVLEQKTLSSLFALGKEVVISFFAGGFLFGLLLAVPGYVISLYLVKAYRRRKEEKKKRKYGTAKSG